MDYDYGREQLRAAVAELAGPGMQRERLMRAVSSSLNRIIADQHLPPELRAEFSQLMEDMTSRRGREPSQSSGQATVPALRPQQVRAAVETVLSLYDRVCRYMPKDLR